jgi:hypothetical protein
MNIYSFYFKRFSLIEPIYNEMCNREIRNRDISVSIATGYALDARGKGSEFEFRYGQEYSFLHVVQIGSGAHPASYPMGTGGSFPGSKAARA